MNTNRITMIIALALAGIWALAWFYYPKLPDMVPVHWNMEGEADRYQEKPWGALVLPIVATVSQLFLMVLPRISPKGFRLDNARRAYDVVRLVIVLFMVAVTYLAYEAALGRATAMERWLPAGVGLLLVIIGNYLTKFPRNFWVGIRTPWTLASETVWFKTHRLAAVVFIVGGIGIIVVSLLNLGTEWMVGSILVTALIPVVYSYLCYRQLHGFKPDSSQE